MLKNHALDIQTKSYSRLSKAVVSISIAIFALAPIGAAASYINVYGRVVPSPSYFTTAPASASAKCKDGTYSFSMSRRGTCSGHKGVARWL